MEEALDKLKRELFLGSTDFLQWCNDQQLLNYVLNLKDAAEALIKELDK